MDNKIKVVSTNKFANFNYTLLEKFTAGMVLKGCEIKSIRQNGITLNESFILISKDGVVLKNSFVKPYQTVNNFSPKPDRDRMLLLNKNEILKLKQKTEQKGLTIVPVKAFFVGSYLKLEIALAQGKKLYNKKETIKERDIMLEAKRQMKM